MIRDISVKKIIGNGREEANILIDVNKIIIISE